jgi:hypothetical protein
MGAIRRGLPCWFPLWRSLSITDPATPMRDGWTSTSTSTSPDGGGVAWHWFGCSISSSQIQQQADLQQQADFQQQADGPQQPDASAPSS